jgi:TonB family protein
MQQGDEARENGRNETAKAVYSKLLAASGNGTEAAAALLRRGTVELAMKDIPAAIADFEQAQADDFGKAAEARMWLAIAQQRQHNLREARTLYESSLAVTDPHSPAAATTMELYAQMLEADSDQLEAGKLRQQASEIRTAQTAQAAAKPQTFPPVYRAGGDTSSPVLISKVEPEYTAEARIAGYSGTSLLSVLVGADGMIRDVQVRRSQGFGLDEKAIEAVLQWKFKPGIREGQAVVVRATIEINFHTL